MSWKKYRAEISCEDFPSTFCPWIVHSGEKETPDCNGRGFSYGLKSGDSVPIYCLAGVRGSRTHLPRSSRGITDLKLEHACLLLSHPVLFNPVLILNPG